MDLDAFFRGEVKPALGCTEPGAVAYATSTAAEYLGGAPENISLELSPNIYKNGVNVGVPNTGGLRGNNLAAILGAIAGIPRLGLQSLANVKPSDVAEAQRLISIVSTKIVEKPGVYIRATLKRGKVTSTVVISGRHDNIVEIIVDGKTLLKKEEGKSASGGDDYAAELLTNDMDGLWRLAGGISTEQEALMLEGALMNTTAVEQGIKSSWGCGVGYYLNKRATPRDLLWNVKAKTGGAADFRMGGGPGAIMSSSGSGNHGITAIVPVVVVAESLGSTKRELAEALALSHLVTRYVKAYTGIITPTCGCSIAAGSGASAAIVHLMGGTPKQAEIAIANLIASVMGMVCDGGKGSCALKVSTAAGEAYTSALLALSGGGVTDTQGLIKPDLRNIAETLGTLSKKGFQNLDTLILDIMKHQN